jgi:hypothetical protein
MHALMPLWFTFPELVRAPAFAVFFWAVAFALGSRVLRVLGFPSSSLSAAEEALVSLAIGAGVLPLLPCMLAVFGAMTVPHVRAAFFLLSVLCVPDFVRAGRRSWDAMRGSSFGELSPEVKAWCGLLAAALIILFARALVLGDMGDDDGYHLSGPKRWLEAGTLRYLPTYTHTNGSLGFEMLYVIALAVSDAVGAKLLHFSAGLFALFGVLSCTKRLSTTQAGMTAVSVLMIPSPLVAMAFVFPLAFVDLAACWMTVVSILLWLVWRERREWVFLVPFALTAGFVGAFKFTSLAVVLAWLPVILFEEKRAGRNTTGAFEMVLAFGAIATAPIVPWLGRNLVLTGNPFYPMLSSYIPSRDWTVEQGRVFGTYIHYFAWGVNWKLSLAMREALCFAVAVAIAASAFAAIERVKRPALKSLILFAATFGLVSLAMTGLFFRYWLPAVTAIVIVVATCLTDRLRAKQLSLVACVLMAVALRNNQGFVDNVRLASGFGTVREQHSKDPFFRMWDYINASTPSEAKILTAAFYTTFGASSFGGFLVDRPCYVTDSHLQTYIRFDTWDAFVDSVESAGITHVVISDKQFDSARRGFSYAAGNNEYSFSRRLVDTYGERLQRFEHLELYRLHFGKPVAANQGRN